MAKDNPGTDDKMKPRGSFVAGGLFYGGLIASAVAGAVTFVVASPRVDLYDTAAATGVAIGVYLLGSILLGTAPHLAQRRTPAEWMWPYLLLLLGLLLGRVVWP